MRQSTLTTTLGLTLAPQRRPTDMYSGLVALVQREEEGLLFHAVLPQGSVLKCVSELLLRCATQTPLVVHTEAFLGPRPTLKCSVLLDAQGITLTACDQNSGRLIHSARFGTRSRLGTPFFLV